MRRSGLTLWISNKVPAPAEELLGHESEPMAMDAGLFIGKLSFVEHFRDGKEGWNDRMPCAGDMVRWRA
jgi:hypothetical protein